MTMEIVKGQAETQLAEAVKVIQSMAEAMQRMAAAAEETRERMAELERTVKTLEKVTPRQAAQINTAIRARAAEIREDWRMSEAGGKAVASAIRKAVRIRTGAWSMKEVARCDCGAVTEMIRNWEDVETIRKAKAAERRREG